MYAKSVPLSDPTLHIFEYKELKLTLDISCQLSGITNFWSFGCRLLICWVGWFRLALITNWVGIKITWPTHMCLSCVTLPFISMHTHWFENFLQQCRLCLHTTSLSVRPTVCQAATEATQSTTRNAFENCNKRQNQARNHCAYQSAARTDVSLEQSKHSVCHMVSKAPVCSEITPLLSHFPSLSCVSNTFVLA